MQIEELKNLWQKMDESNGQQHMLSQQMFKQMLKDRASNNINSVVNMDTLGLAIVVLLTLVFTLIAPAMRGSVPLITCYTISAIILVASIAHGCYRISMLNKLDMGNMPVHKYQQQAEKIKLLTTRELYVSVVLGPVMITCFYAVMIRWVRGIDVFDNMSRYTPFILVACIAYTIIVIILYNRFYFYKLNAIISNLRELQDFDK